MTRRLVRIELEHLLQPKGWLSPAWVEVDDEGFIRRVESARPSDWTSESIRRFPGFTIPGMPNAHSHAFQRALVGRTERNAPGQRDSFWTWRTAMYDLASRIEPEQLEVIASQVYIEMLEAGMTSVGEFHYLHHAPSGQLYDDHAEMSLRIFSAAHRTGIALTHLPVLYLHGGFARAAELQQRRFVHRDVDHFIDLVARLQQEASKVPSFRVGVAPHSLRAVDEESLIKVIADVQTLDASAPIHIHIAEQSAEVRDAEAHLGSRPVRWLLEHLPVDNRWCLIHATHLDDGEVDALIRSNAVVGLCPSTEANLGDGIFRGREFSARRGQLAIGSDSHVCLDVAEELRWLELGQRLRDQERNLMSAPDAQDSSVGRSLFERCCEGGAIALNQPVGAAIPGRRADLVVLDADHPRLAGHGTDTALDAWIFGSASGCIKDVIAGGEHLVQDGRHYDREGTRLAFTDVMRQLLA